MSSSNTCTFCFFDGHTVTYSNQRCTPDDLIDFSSYLHCAWKTEAEIEVSDKRIGGKIKRFEIKRECATTICDEVCSLE